MGHCGPPDVDDGHKRPMKKKIKERRGRDHKETWRGNHVAEGIFSWRRGEEEERTKMAFQPSK